MKHGQNKVIKTKSLSVPPTNGAVGVDHYHALHQGFRWQVDEFFNIAQACCGRWAEAETRHSPAIRTYQTGAATLVHSYAQLQQAADALSHQLKALGVARGDRVAIVMPQRFETAVAFMAVLQMGAVAMPLSILFGPEAMAFRLQDSGAVVALADESAMDSLLSVRAACPQLQSIVAVGAACGRGDCDFVADAAKPRRFRLARTRADEAAILIYTSGTTGQPKGALIPHRALIGNLSGFVCSQNWFGFDGQDNTQSAAVFWSPADWAWTGGLMDALLPTLYFGRPIVAFNGRFSPKLAFELMASEGVTHSFLFPTALKAMMKAYPTPRAHFALDLQGLMSAGEAVGDAVFDYCRDQLGVVVNEMFGQTEINYVVGNCNRFWPARAGSMGKGYPGHLVAVIDEEGVECAVGVPGDVAVRRHDIHGDLDPIFFLGYWNNDAATQAKFANASGEKSQSGWCRTGDLARRDADGYLWYEGRADDVFKAAGYRIGPGEIENCLVKHVAVANAAVVPKPDTERGALVKAYVVLSAQQTAARASLGSDTASFDAALTLQLQRHVKAMLAPYEYPKEIEYLDALPMTTTGKVQRRVLRLQEEARFAARSLKTAI